MCCLALWATMVLMISLPPPKNVPQWRVNDFWSCILDNQWPTQPHQPRIIVSPAFMAKNATDDIASTFWEWVSSEHHWSVVLHLWQSEGYGTTLTHNPPIGCLHRQKWYWRYCIRLRQFQLSRSINISYGGRPELHSNETYCVVTTLSFTWSVISIWPCIQLHKYVCNVSQIRLFLLVSQKPIFRNPHSALL